MFLHVGGDKRCVYLRTCGGRYEMCVPTYISYVSRYLGVSRYREAVCTYLWWEVEDLCITTTLYCVGVIVVAQVYVCMVYCVMLSTL